MAAPCSLCCRPIDGSAYDHIDISPDRSVPVHLGCAALLDSLPDDDGGLGRVAPLPWELAFNPELHAIAPMADADVDLLVASLYVGPR